MVLLGLRRRPPHVGPVGGRLPGATRPVLHVHSDGGRRHGHGTRRVGGGNAAPTNQKGASRGTGGRFWPASGPASAGARTDPRPSGSPARDPAAAGGEGGCV